MTRELKPCGTHAAYCRHVSRREEPCDPCKAAYAEYGRARLADSPEAVSNARAASRAYYWRRKRGEEVHVDPCGTPTAYRRHLRHGEEACVACLAAWSAYCSERYYARKAAAS